MGNSSRLEVSQFNVQVGTLHRVSKSVNRCFGSTLTDLRGHLYWFPASAIRSTARHQEDDGEGEGGGKNSIYAALETRICDDKNPTIDECYRVTQVAIDYVTHALILDFKSSNL